MNDNAQFTIHSSQLRKVFIKVFLHCALCTVNCALSLWAESDKIAEYLSVLGSDTLEVYQKQAKESLIKMGPEILPLLEEAYAKSSPDKQAVLLEVAGEVKSLASVPFLMKAAQTGAVVPQCRALEALGKIGDPQAVPLLMERLQHENPSIRCFAIWSLGEMGSQTAVGRLRALLQRKESLYPTVAAIDALGKIGDKEAAGDILPYLKHSELQVRYVAAIALGNLQEKSTVSPLFGALDVEPDYEVQEVMVKALGKIGGQEVLARFMEMFKSRSSLPRRHLAGQGLATIGLPAVDYVRQCLREQDWEIQLSAIKLLGELRAKDAVPELLKTLESSNKSLQLAAIVALGQCDDPRALEPLSRIKESGDALLQDTASEVMAKIISSGGR